MKTVRMIVMLLAVVAILLPANAHASYYRSGCDYNECFDYGYVYYGPCYEPFFSYHQY